MRADDQLRAKGILFTKVAVFPEKVLHGVDEYLLDLRMKIGFGLLGKDEVQ